MGETDLIWVEVISKLVLKRVVGRLGVKMLKDKVTRYTFVVVHRSVCQTNKYTKYERHIRCNSKRHPRSLDQGQGKEVLPWQPNFCLKTKVT